MSRKTQIGWMTLGVMLCLFSVVLTLKIRDGNKAVASDDNKNNAPAPSDPPPPLPSLPDSPPLPDFKPPEVILKAPEAPEPILLTGAKESEPPLPSPPPPMDLKPAPGKPLPAIRFPEDKSNAADPTPAPPIPDPLPAPTSWRDPVTPPVPPADPRVPPVPKPSVSLPATEVKKDIQPVSAVKPEPGEPPMVVQAGPVQIYQVRGKTETLPDIARRTLGTSERWHEIQKLNPALKADAVLAFGETLRLPADACIQEDPDAVKPLPSLRPKGAPAKAKVMPLTGTFPCNLDDRKILTLPKAIREQLGNCETVLVSPGSDHCLWITNHAHLERMAERIEASPAREVDVRVFKRLYYAQTEKTPVTGEGRIAISDKLAQFAGLGQELVIVGIDEHFEVWDAARWKQYTQQKSAEARSSMGDE